MSEFADGAQLHLAHRQAGVDHQAGCIICPSTTAVDSTKATVKMKKFFLYRLINRETKQPVNHTIGQWSMMMGRDDEEHASLVQWYRSNAHRDDEPHMWAIVEFEVRDS